MSYSLIVTPAFKKAAKDISKKHKSLKADLSALFASIELEPQQGKPLGKDCYKIRLAIASKGKGKSGGARLITCVKVTKEKIYLLTVYDKSEQEDITDKELTQLLAYIE